ncbi:MAG: hypothetical protein ACF788_09725 [Novipirellula sp. JB048]
MHVNFDSTAKDVQGLKYLKVLQPLLQSLHEVGTQRDTAGNRHRLYVDHALHGASAKEADLRDGVLLHRWLGNAGGTGGSYQKIEIMALHGILRLHAYRIGLMLR